MYQPKSTHEILQSTFYPPQIYDVASVSNQRIKVDHIVEAQTQNFLHLHMATSNVIKCISFVYIWVSFFPPGGRGGLQNMAKQLQGFGKRH